MFRFGIFLYVLVLVSPFLIMEVWTWRHAREYQADRDDPEETKTKFRRRRKLAFLYAALSVPCVVVPFLLMTSGDVQALGVVSAFGAAMSVFSTVYRCPICYKIPMDAVDGWDLNPAACEGCGAPLTGD